MKENRFNKIDTIIYFSYMIIFPFFENDGRAKLLIFFSILVITTIFLAIVKGIELIVKSIKRKVFKLIYKILSFLTFSLIVIKFLESATIEPWDIKLYYSVIIINFLYTIITTLSYNINESV